MIATKKEFTENGFWKSGDVGFKDEEGYIYILDRKKDIINRVDITFILQKLKI